MTTTTLALPDADVRRHVRPSREQLRVAAAMFAVASEDITSVVVPVVVPVGVPGADDRLEYPGGFWLADRSAHDGHYAFGSACEAAEATAEAYVRDGGGHGLPGWVTIRTDGTWSAFDGLLAAA
jgi:hypothetical protein